MNNVCPICGVKLSGNQRFCYQCGYIFYNTGYDEYSLDESDSGVIDDMSPPTEPVLKRGSNDYKRLCNKVP